jgi:radical SAM protein with 4Fe4S-binding SPASM domain
MDLSYKNINLISKETQEFNQEIIEDYSRILLRIESNNHCNFKCVFCPHPDMERTKGFMDQHLYYSIIDQAATLGFKKLDLRNFGEPLLDKRLGAFAKYANEKGLDKIYIHTNGYGITEKILNKWGEGGITDVNISLSPKREFGLSRPGTNVEKMFSCLEKVMKSNSKWKHILSVDYIRTNESTEEEEKEFFSWLKEYDLVKRIDINLHNWAKGDDLISYNQCHRLWTSITVLWNGQVSLCCLDYEGEINLGNLNTTLLKDIINSKQYQEIRSNHIKGIFLEKCSKCDMVKAKDFGPKPNYTKIDS